MFAKLLTKNPVFMVGMLLFTIFLFDLRDREIFSSRKKRVNATSCKAVLVMLNKRIPANWKTKCNKNNLAVSIALNLTNKEAPKDKKGLRPIMYRELANNLIAIAKNSPQDSLERTHIVTLRLDHKDLTIDAVTEGQFIVKLATIQTKALIGEHLKNTVQVKETIK